jgi:hypothetical protein
VDNKKSYNRRDVVKLAGAVAALGAGLGIVLKPGQSWAQTLDATKYKGQKSLYTYQVKFYSSGADKPVFCTDIPEATARQILGLEKAESTNSDKVEQISIKIERTSTQTNQTEVIGENLVQFKFVKIEKQADRPVGTR